MWEPSWGEVDKGEFMSMHFEFWTGEEFPVMKKLVYVDKICARLCSEYHMYAYKIKEAQTRGMRFELQSSDRLEAYLLDTEQRHLTDSDKKDINELMSNLFKSHKGPSSNLKFNLATANREYENYCDLRDDLIEEADYYKSIYRAHITYSDFASEIEPLLNSKGFKSRYIRPILNAKVESYEVENYDIPYNKALLNVLDYNDKLRGPSPYDHPESVSPYTTPFRMRFRFFDCLVDNYKF